MDDAELDQIRQRRMQELMAKQGAGAGMGGMGGMGSAEEAEQKEEQQRAAEEQRRMMIRSICTPEARERLARIALVKPEKARSIENMLLAAAQRGQITEKVSEERLVAMLESVQAREATSKPKITIQRRRPLFEDDDDD